MTQSLDDPYADQAPAGAEAPLCPFCDQPVTVWKGQGDPQARMVAVVEGDFKWAHVGCVHFKRKGKRTVVEGYKERREHPPCALCNEAWDDHEPFGHRTRSCPEPHCMDGTQLYHHAPGKVGPEPPEWLRIAHPIKTAIDMSRRNAWGEIPRYRGKVAA